MLEKESSPGPSSISPKTAAISYTDAETLVFSDMVPDIAAVSSMNTETAESSIMLQKESKCRLFFQIQMTEKD